MVNLFPIAPKGGPTFQKNHKSSNIDFLAHFKRTNKEYRGNEIESTVLQRDTASDHKYIPNTVDKEGIQTNSQQVGSKWRNNELGAKRIGRILRRKGKQEKDILNEEEDKLFLENMYDLMDIFLDRNNKEIKRTSKINWWNKEVRNPKQKLKKARRNMQRARKNKQEDMEEWYEARYKYNISRRS